MGNKRDSPTGVCIFRPGGDGPPTETLISFIDQYKGIYGVEPICKQIPIASSTYYEQKPHQQEPERQPLRVQRDRVLMAEIRRVWEDNRCVYGVRKVWRTMKQEGITASRCTTWNITTTPTQNSVQWGCTESNPL